MAGRDLDDSGLFGELRRMVRTTGTVGGIAARIAGHRIGITGGSAAHAEDLKGVLGGLKGPLMKAAQLLATIPGALPDDYALELSQLQSNAPPMGWSFVRRRMSTELGPNWQQRFKQFGQEAAAAASLGQVHKAVLPDGKIVACKLQYPDMTTTVEADLKQFRMAMGVYHRLDNAIRQDDVIEELTERLREELDYTREAANLRLYGVMLRNSESVTIPRTVPDLCTRRLLTMQWVDGRSLQSVLDTNPSQEERNAMARALFEAWYVPLYRYGVIHGDPHMGNFTVRDDFGFNLLDFGAIRVFRPRFVRGIIELCEGLRVGDLDRTAHAYEMWGFRNLSRDTMTVLNEWASFLYEPLMQDRERAIQEDEGSIFGRDIAARVHAGLQRTGGVKPPREFVLVDRSAIGLGSVFMRLGAKLNWHRMFQDLIADFNEDDLARRQQAALQEAGVKVGA
ncbi:ABC transporter ATP-binding protein [Acetobacter nitrogenifigens DSM 23921 = NBRC 105050]|uniref:ABC transporter ATP-binding protein n=1 Tax=Acetobacter nitrogenifigens DSM 23921 = NBRC 105050 TaxID=1120919 RepID=A0A511X8D0_9PROT|nr:AarF/ABC1/UbiB kinase family protein [Acetobacter nitrogenifigens]GBQ89650.1 ABC transporter ATP-binding protein [Acetobacter nitrogenifigens DSM 23921 = NBRC 105050]GEN59202.1 ABC transporter ATP-binding protein [Acetobacter nitrogenifigens DSM 23921 = NBRC 105050]